MESPMKMDDLGVPPFSEHPYMIRMYLHMYQLGVPKTPTGFQVQ